MSSPVSRSPSVVRCFVLSICVEVRAEEVLKNYLSPSIGLFTNIVKKGVVSISETIGMSDCESIRYPVLFIAFVNNGGVECW